MVTRSDTPMLLWTAITAVLVMQQVKGGDRTLGNLRHLRRHDPGRASPPAGPAAILEGKEAKTSCELFIAVPSSLLERRSNIRETWGRGVKAGTAAIMAFYLHEDDEDASTVAMVREEQSQHNDIVLIMNDDFGTALATGQAGVTQRVYLMMQHAQANYDFRLFMKADDDTFVHVPVVLNALRETVKDRFVYIGYPMSKTQQNEGAELGQLWLDDIGEKGDWAPSMSTPYMQGAAYILSKEAVDAIVAVNHATGLRYMRDEDHTVGTWVSPMHLKYLSGDDIGLFFWPWGLHDEYIMEAENYCQKSHQPVGWVHMLKKREDMELIFRLAQGCADVPPSL